MTKKLKTGLLGGSFNPIHIGHLALANWICEQGEVDELWFLVSPQNPLKKEEDLLDENLRLKMVQLAIEDYPKFKASDFEFHLPRPSYTVHTLEALEEAYPERDFTLFIGADNWAKFHQWFQWEKIEMKFNINIYPRLHFPIDESQLPPRAFSLRAPVMEISSTFIRESIQKGHDVRFFLHPNVAQFIQKLQLYRKRQL